MAKTGLVPIKVKLIRKASGEGIEWPDLNQVSEEIREGMTWSRYVDVKGIRWHYNKVSNLGTGADFGEAATCVPEAFADAAIALYPDIIVEMTEVEFEDFYNNKAHAHESDEEFDTDVLQGIQTKRDLGLALTSQQQSAIDPDTDTRGIRKNKKRFWVDFKADQEISLAEGRGVPLRSGRPSGSS